MQSKDQERDGKEEERRMGRENTESSRARGVKEGERGLTQVLSRGEGHHL